MLDLCIQYYDNAKKQGLDIKAMTKYDNLKILQQAIQKKENRFYELGELESCVKYCNIWSK